MTFREKLQEEYPLYCKPGYVGGCSFCPSNYGYEPFECGLCKEKYDRDRTVDDFRELFNELEDGKLCTKCWDRECHETKCRYCGGTLSEIRVHNGRRLQHCYSCHFEFYLD